MVVSPASFALRGRPRAKGREPGRRVGGQVRKPSQIDQPVKTGAITGGAHRLNERLTVLRLPRASTASTRSV